MHGQEQELLCAIQEARKLLKEGVEDDTQPYKRKYAAADLLLMAKKKAETLLSDATEVATQASLAVAECIACCSLERGLALIETDLAAEGQQELERALQYPWQETADAWAIQQQAHNALAALWCDRGDTTVSLQHLTSATELHAKIGRSQQDVSRVLDHDGRPASAGSVDSSWAAALNYAANAEAQYATTLYYLAQVHGHAGNKEHSAAYCAATLNKQLQQGIFDVNDWVQNCLQLSGYFLDHNLFPLAEYCCAAVEAVLLQQYQAGQPACQAAAAVEVKTAAAESAAADHDQQPITDQVADPANAVCRVSIPSSSKEQQEKQLPDGLVQASKDSHCRQASSCQAEQLQHQKENESLVDRIRPALQILDEDVAANVHLGVAKLHLYRLVASHQRYIEGKTLQYIYSQAADVPDIIRFDALPNLPELSSLRWGDAALAADAAAASAFFKSSLPCFREALQYYKLDGWVTEHCNILFEMSNLYRCLAGFESDPHKRCVMHRQRSKLLQPLEGELSPQHYSGLSRSISLELGNIFREIADIKATCGREPGKVASAMATAVQHYQIFLDSFRGTDGQLPDKVEPGMEEHYLSGAFSLARVLQGMPQGAGPDWWAARQRSVSLLDMIVKYVKENGVSSWQQEADLAMELSQLVQESMKLTQSVASLRQQKLHS